MRQAGIQGLYRRRRRGCTVRDPAAEPAADLVNRQFTVDGPNRLWITDITEHPTEEGKVYCAAVMDAYSRLVIGWSIADHMRTELVTDALGMAVLRRQPSSNPETGETILHSDHGAQYTSWAFGQRRWTARFNGHCRRLLRQFHDGIVLGHHATRTPRHPTMENPRRSCQCDLRMDRMLVQPETETLPYRNAQPRHV
jgi:transposase InsO family protein